MTYRKPIKFNYSLSDEEITLYKYYNCEYYGICLDKASRKNWKNFLCISCPIFKRYNKTRKQIDERFSRNNEDYFR